MGTKENIFSLLREKQMLSGKQLSDLLGISRQAVNKHLKTLTQEGLVVKQGVTRGATYSIASSQGAAPAKFKKNYVLNGLEEDKVFLEIEQALRLKKGLSASAADIARYSFTEMLNNAIDHSQSEKCLVEATLDNFTFRFRIRDYGIGLFFSIYRKFQLKDENTALGELLKGKTTTMREKHSGEGIFFTSKTADHMFLRSHRLKIIFDNSQQDTLVEELKHIKGTEVAFSINKRSRKKIDRIFATYAPEEFDYRFDKTRALVNLFLTECVSRSEAKRLLHGLDKFKVAVFDFKGVKKLGQGFADEVFRVFLRDHPEISVEVVNLSPSLRPIVNHVVDKKIKDRLTIS